MKTIKYFATIAFAVIVSSCKQSSNKASDAVEEATDAAKVVADEVFINVDENFTSNFKPIEAASIELKMDAASLASYSTNYSKINNEDDNSWKAFNEAIISSLSIPKECWDARPKTIEGLTDGVLLDAYSFEKGDETKLGFMGFFNVNIKRNQKVVVVEFSQEGTQYCSQVPYKYGVGARLMMKVTKSKNSAKLNTPQQITASVVYGKAEVTYSLKTFGIVGPGVAELAKTGSLSEDTYQEFLKKIADLIVNMYKKKSDFTITPQPLLLERVQG